MAEQQRIEPDGPTCESQEECGEGELCQSPEEASWNHCGAPMEPLCPPGMTGDHCGHCFTVCDDDSPCPEGLSCNGSQCISPRTCREPRRAPP